MAPIRWRYDMTNPDCPSCRNWVIASGSLPLHGCRKDHLMRACVLAQIYISWCPSPVLLLHRSEYMLPEDCDKFEPRSKKQKVKVGVLSPGELEEYKARFGG